MIEREIDIATRDGAMNTWTVRSDEGGPLPVVLMLMDAPGVREGLREIGRRIARSGYFVLLPNLSRTEIEPGTHHGYAFTDRGTYDQAASEKHFARMLELYRHNLG